MSEENRISINIRLPVRTYGALQINDPDGTPVYMVATVPDIDLNHVRNIRLPTLKKGLYRLYFNFEVP